MDIHPRASWAAAPPRSRASIHLPSPRLWLHHTAGAMARGTIATVAVVLRAIQRFHQSPPPAGRGWVDIAYSFLVDQEGRAWEGRGAGVAGGHTRGDNTGSHAICVMGDHDIHPVPESVIDGVARLQRHGAARGWWPPRITGGHQQAPGAATSCPGRHLMRVLPEINRRAVGTVALPPLPPPGGFLMSLTVDQQRQVLASTAATAARVQQLQEELVEPIDSQGRSRADRMARLPDAVRDLDRRLDRIEAMLEKLVNAA